MKTKILMLKQFFRRLVDILSKLEVPPESGHVMVFRCPPHNNEAWLRDSVHYLKVSAKHFGESTFYLRASIRCSVFWIKKTSNSLRLRFVECRQACWQSLRLSGCDVHCSCPPLGAQNVGPSSEKTVENPLPQPVVVKAMANHNL